jgi:hypothetical protein
MLCQGSWPQCWASPSSTRVEISRARLTSYCSCVYSQSNRCHYCPRHHHTAAPQPRLLPLASSNHLAPDRVSNDMLHPSCKRNKPQLTSFLFFIVQHLFLILVLPRHDGQDGAEGLFDHDARVVGRVVDDVRVDEVAFARGGRRAAAEGDGLGGGLDVG